MKIIIIFSFIFTFLFGCICYAEHPDTTFKFIENKYETIKTASKRFNVNPKVLSAIIYVERTENYDWKDDALDILLADNGINSSIGFCQIKLKTAYFLEVQLNDSTAKYYPGDGYGKYLSVSQSKEEIIEKLADDSLNIHYAAAYIRIIQSRWERADFSINDKPSIISTLYSTGLFHYDGKERKPNVNPEANKFGKKVRTVLKRIFK